MGKKRKKNESESVTKKRKRPSRKANEPAPATGRKRRRRHNPMALGRASFLRYGAAALTGAVLGSASAGADKALDSALVVNGFKRGLADIVVSAVLGIGAAAAGMEGVASGAVAAGFALGSARMVADLVQPTDKERIAAAMLIRAKEQRAKGAGNGGAAAQQGTIPPVGPARMQRPRLLPAAGVVQPETISQNMGARVAR